MHDTNDRPTLMPAKRESAMQSAARLRRTLHRRWPTVPFSVRLAPGDEITVTWSDGPLAADVARAAHGKLAISSSQRLSRLEVRISSNATATEDSRIRNTTTEGVPAVFTVVPPAQIDGVGLACKWPNCDEILRGGVEIKSGLAGSVATSGPASGAKRCTLGFVARRPNGARVGVTAGHCKSDVSSSWTAYDSTGSPLTTQLSPTGTNGQFEWSSRGGLRGHRSQPQH